jgi:hypothetical protein
MNRLLTDAERIDKLEELVSLLSVEYYNQDGIRIGLLQDELDADHDLRKKSDGQPAG